MSLKSIFILVALFGVALADNAEIDDFIVKPRILVHELNISAIFDKILPSVQRYITLNGFDPLDAPDMDIPLSPWPDLFQTKVHLHHGRVQELSTIYRKGDVILQWTAEKASVYLNLAFTTLDVSYEYIYRWMLYQRKGDTYGRFHGVDAKIMFDLDFKMHKLRIRFLKFTACSDFALKLEGNFGDGILNFITKALTKKFKTEVLKIIEMSAYEQIEKKVDEVNSAIAPDVEEKIKEIIADQESNKP